MPEIRGDRMLTQNTGSCVCLCMHILVPDIPDDEAQYWTGKLERINTMSIHDEVKKFNKI